MISSDDLRFIVALAQSNSLAAASRALNVTPSAVTQRLQSMEERIGFRLVDRSSRRMVLTDEGDKLANGGQRVLEELGDLIDTLNSRRAEVSGHLRIVAPLGFGRRYVAPAATQFRLLFPNVTVSLMLFDRPAHLGEDGWDLMIYVGQLRNSSLISHVLASNERFVCAAPDYLARVGTPKRPKDLLNHHCIALRENDEDVALWRLPGTQRGERETVRIKPVCSSNDGEVIRNWAVGRAGVIVRSEWDVADDIRAGRLVRVLDRWKLPSANVMALLGPRHGRSLRTRRFLQQLHSTLTPLPWRQKNIVQPLIR